MMYSPCCWLPFRVGVFRVVSSFRRRRFLGSSLAFARLLALWHRRLCWGPRGYLVDLAADFLAGLLDGFPARSFAY